MFFTFMRNPLEDRDSTMVTVQLFAVTFNHKIVPYSSSDYKIITLRDNGDYEDEGGVDFQ